MKRIFKILKVVFLKPFLLLRSQKLNMKSRLIEKSIWPNTFPDKFNLTHSFGVSKLNISLLSMASDSLRLSGVNMGNLRFRLLVFFFFLEEGKCSLEQ